MKNELEGVVAHIKEKGLPGVDQMREEVAERDAENFKAMIQQKLSEYTALFNRWKDGEDLTDAEVSRMASLSEELAKLSEGIRSEKE